MQNLVNTIQNPGAGQEAEKQGAQTLHFHLANALALVRSRSFLP